MKKYIILGFLVADVVVFSPHNSRAEYQPSAEEVQKKITSLHKAAKADDVESVSALMLFSSDINRQDSNGKTALHWAAEHSALSACRTLLEGNAALTIKDKDNNEPFFYAVKTEIDDLIKLFLKHHASIDSISPAGDGWRVRAHAVRVRDAMQAEQNKAINKQKKCPAYCVVL